jgi:hypothetical protein
MIDVMRIAQMLSTRNYLELLDDIKILREGHGLLYTPHDLPESAFCTASFMSTFACTSRRVRASKTIVIVHISNAGQGLECNSQEKAIPTTSIKKNQSAQD